MVKRFLASHYSGFYLRVLREGEVGAGDEIVPFHQYENGVSVLDILRIHLHESDSTELLHRALQVEYLSPVLAQRIQRAELESTTRNHWAELRGSWLVFEKKTSQALRERN